MAKEQVKANLQLSAIMRGLLVPLVWAYFRGRESVDYWFNDKRDTEKACGTECSTVMHGTAFQATDAPKRYPQQCCILTSQQNTILHFVTRNT